MDVKIGVRPGSSMQELLCLEGYVLTEEPAKVFAQGRQVPVPLLVSSTADEGTLFARLESPRTVAEYRRRVQTLAPRDFEQILQLYPANDDASVRAAYAAALGDSAFTNSARNMARWHASAGNPTYRAFFTHTTLMAKRMELGAFHGSEIPFVFFNVQGPQFTRVEHDLAQIVSESWVAFARTGSPQTQHTGHWPAYDVKLDNTMVFEPQPRLQNGIRTAECDLWERLRR